MLLGTRDTSRGHARGSCCSFEASRGDSRGFGCCLPAAPKLLPYLEVHSVGQDHVKGGARGQRRLDESLGHALRPRVDRINALRLLRLSLHSRRSRNPASVFSTAGDLMHGSCKHVEGLASMVSTAGRVAGSALMHAWRLPACGGTLPCNSAGRVRDDIICNRLRLAAY